MSLTAVSSRPNASSSSAVTSSPVNNTSASRIDAALGRLNSSSPTTASGSSSANNNITMNYINSRIGSTSPVLNATAVSASNVRIVYGSSCNTHIPAKAEKELKNICAKAGLGSVKITSTTRTPADQARIMYDNIQSQGVKKQKALYGPSGDKVIDVYSKQKKAGKSPAQIKAAMEKKIIEVGPQKVSKHCVTDTSKLSVFDVAPSSIPNSKKAAFEKAVNANSNVSKFLKPPSDPAYHIEMKL